MNHSPICWRLVAGLLLCFSWLAESYAKVRLPALISDRMVLQRDVDLHIWGWADQGEVVTVKFLGKTYHTKPDHEGKWSVQLAPQQAGGPYCIEINEIIIRDVLIGDVWLGSGQSNMETPIARLAYQYPEINVSNNHMIRYYKVPTQHSAVAKKQDIPAGGKWHSATASDVMNWTALAYFYAQQMYEHTRVPQGMLISSLGGSAIESWISQEHLKQFPDFLVDEEAWQQVNFPQQAALTQQWKAADWNTNDWQTTLVPGLWREQGINTRGTIYYRKDFELADTQQGRYAQLFLGTLVDSDSVFVNGHFVGSTAYMYPPRNYVIPAGILKAGKNNITIRLTDNGGNGGFVQDKTYKITLDDLDINLAGEWKYKVAIDMSLMDQYQQRLKNLKSAGSSLYNGMIYPLQNYKVKGAIWYQGESNAGAPKNYQALLTALISDWRNLFQAPTMPFLLVQLPNFMAKPNNPPTHSGWAAIREAQLGVAQQMPYTALTVNYDIGEWNDIHPLNKKDMAARLVLQARKLIAKENIVSAGPQFKAMEIAGDHIILSFTNIGGGLKAKDGTLKHFAIAGSDHKFVWANAVIKGKTILVSSKEVANPVAVRYAWSDNPEEANLINKEGLLASPFRTDNW